MNNLYSAGVALQNGSGKALMASTMAAYLRRAVEEYQSNMSINGDPTTGIVAWNALNPDIQRALLVQYYKQGPTPDLVTANKRIAARSGIPYVPRIGADGAAATYLANQGAIIRTLADAPADFSDRWGATPESTSSGGAAPPISFPDVAQQAQRLATDRYFGNCTPGSGSEPNVSNGFARFESPRSDAAGPVPFLDSANAARRLFEGVYRASIRAVPSRERSDPAIRPLGLQPALPAPERRSAAPAGLARTPFEIAPLGPDESNPHVTNGSVTPAIDKNFRYLARSIAGQAPVFDTSALAPAGLAGQPMLNLPFLPPSWTFPEDTVEQGTEDWPGQNLGRAGWTRRTR